jgi:hypothetical protein
VKAFVYTTVILSAATLVEVFVPDRAVYHTGWYNVALLALAVVLVFAARATIREAVPSKRAALVAIALGGGILGFTGVANGLFAPDPRTLIGAPGQSMTDPDIAGTFAFPRLGDATTPALLRPGHAPLPIASNRYVGSFVLRTIPRTVVRVEAYDAGGNRLTVTQPTGNVFLSPVLLMQDTQQISGLTLPYDSFALPAAHRIVKVVLFSAQQVAALRGLSGPPAPAVLFAVDDETDRPIPHAIGLARNGESIEEAGIRLRGVVVEYPAVEAIAAPSLPAVAAGCLLLAGGVLFFLFRSRSRS